ncbi:hypothetical protein DPMN_173388 [Dreissena polymorpha]|uniref:Kinesin motor domain-containing protein n=2 Tax=Dreissena polymorpha TaxID=45954 RepID=A0A9D4IE59_DREPO|nr:hypothetical protein DPMN_173388 [Dreissena polymorpha]
MITQVSPVRKNEAETICSLNFAQRVRNVELGAATKRVENGDGTEGSTEDQNDANCSTPQKVPLVGKPNTPKVGKDSTPSSKSVKTNVSTPTSSVMNVKASTPSSSSKMTPVQQMRKK